MFYISISNGLLRDAHPKRMGAAVWEFMWCIDKVTMIDPKGIGWVLGKKPIKLDEIATDLGFHRDTVSLNLIKLEELGYIRRTIAPYGIVIGVNKAKKRFNKNTEPLRKNTEPLRENTEPNKIVSVDSNSKTISSSAQSAEVVFKDHHEAAEYLNKIINDEKTQKHIYLVAQFVAHKGINPGEGFQLKSKKDFSAIVGRYSRTAMGLLKNYELERIEKTLELLASYAPFDWTLETVGKYIAYDPKKMVQTLQSMKKKTYA